MWLLDLGRARFRGDWLTAEWDVPNCTKPDSLEIWSGDGMDMSCGSCSSADPSGAATVDSRRPAFAELFLLRCLPLALLFEAWSGEVREQLLYAWNNWSTSSSLRCGP